MPLALCLGSGTSHACFAQSCLCCFVLITCMYIQLVARPLLHARALVKSMGQITTWDDCAGADMMFFVMKQLGMSSKV